MKKPEQHVIIKQHFTKKGQRFFIYNVEFIPIFITVYKYAIGQNVYDRN